MKKRYFPLLTVAALSVASCGVPSSYTVDGVVADTTLNGRMVYMTDLVTRDVVDSSMIIDGRFSFTGKADTAKIVRIADNARAYRMEFVLENGNIALELGEVEKRGGTPLNEAFTIFMNDVDALQETIYAKQAELMQSTLTDEEKESAWGAFQAELTPKVDALMSKNFDSNRDNVVGAWAVVNWNLEPERLDSVLNLAGENVKQSPMVKKLTDQLEIIKKTAAGQMFTDFTIEQPDGAKVSLSDYVGKGKYVLVDFWASWCRPCRAEIPHIKELYDKYHGDKFDVLGVAVWDKTEDTLKAIEDLGISWPQILNAQQVPTDLYAIAGIPHIILFAPDGTIVARDLRGDDMKAKVAEVMAAK